MRLWPWGRSEVQPAEPAIDTEPTQLALTAWPSAAIRVEHRVTYEKKPAPDPPHTLLVWLENGDGSPITGRFSFPLRPGARGDQFELSRYWDLMDLKDRHQQVILKFEAQWGGW